ncbi:protein-disulfide reductase DsbD family protein [Prosthecochloris marina]|nr:protein-disulfide reductase DsbD domain-containing protein [Prosthecochloris marina]
MMMRWITLLFISLFLFFSTAFSPARASVFGGQSHVSADLFVVDNSSEDGLLVAVHMTMEPGWHVYWQNPGEAGMPVEIEWELPEGLKALPLEFPVPERFDAGGVIGFGYKDEVVLFSRIVPDGELSDRSVDRAVFPLKAKLSWLSCKEVCVPGSDSLQLQPDKADAVQQALADTFRKRIPRTMETYDGDLTIERIGHRKGDSGGYLEIVFAGATALGLKDFFPLFPEKGVKLDGIILTGKSVTVPLLEGSLPEKVEGVVVTETASYVVGGMVGKQSETSAVSSVSGSLPLMLVFAFFGGMLLNVMPCVLPVLGLKVFSLIGPDASESGRRTGRFLSMVFAAGVMFSFWVLAGFVWILQGMGAQIGWGFQFQSPAFVMFIAAVVFAFGLNLFGLFEFDAPVVSGRVGKVATHHGSLGAFVSGVLATTLATPCTAPFLGTALGFAFAQPSWVVFLFFTIIAVGMAFPYVILAWHPSWLKFLPKPGHWMYIFKQLMGFVLVGVVVWLASILNAQSGGDGVLKLFMLLLILAFALWLFGNIAGHGASFQKKLMTWGIGLLAVIGVYFFLIPDETSVKRDVGAAAEGNQSYIDKNGLVWRDFSPVLLDALMQEKKTVFLEFTADWCLTCKLLEASVLSNRSVSDALQRPGVAAVKADWTTRDDAVTALLQRFGRSGVPLFVIIPQGDMERAIVLPEVVTVDMLLSALREAQA